MYSISDVNSGLEQTNEQPKLPPSVQKTAENIIHHSLGDMRHLMCQEGSNGGIELNDVQQQTRDLAKVVSNLSYREYLLLVDLLLRLRADTSLSFTGNAKAVLDKYRGEHTLINPNTPASTLEQAIGLLEKLESQPNFRGDALLLTRAVYPFGKNAVNKTFDPRQRFALNAKEKHTIKNGQASYDVSPATDDGSVTISLGNRSISLSKSLFKISEAEAR